MRTIGSDTLAAGSTCTVHVFEAEGLRKAPYTFLGIQLMVGPITRADGSQIGSPGQPMGTCQFCGTGIKDCYFLRSADGREFYVGCDCIRKSGDKGLLRVVSVEEKKKRRAAAERKREKANAARMEVREHVIDQLTNQNLRSKLAGQKHPVIPGMTLLDYVEFLVFRAASYRRALDIVTLNLKEGE